MRQNLILIVSLQSTFPVIILRTYVHYKQLLFCQANQGLDPKKTPTGI